MKCGVDFKVGYSPERINPGDKVHRPETIIKIVAGMDAETLDVIAKVYELVVEAGVRRAEQFGYHSQVILAGRRINNDSLLSSNTQKNYRMTQHLAKGAVFSPYFVAIF